MTEINDELQKLMKINTSLKRMDSFMVASHIKTLSRIELLYTCIADMVIYLHKNHQDQFIDTSLSHYYNHDDYNKVIYHSDESNGNKIRTLLNDAKILLDKCNTGAFDEISQY